MLTRIWLPAATALAFTASGSSVEDLAYAPEKGLTLTRSFVGTGDYTLEGVSLTVDGEEPPGMPEPPSVEITTKRTMGVTDRIVEPGDGRPTRLERTFDELTNEVLIVVNEDNEQEQNGFSDLTGSTVVFTWNDEEEAYDVEPAEGEEIDEELLGRLDEDMDLRPFLPGEEVEVGASWELDAEAYLAVNSMGGHLGFHDEDADEPRPDQLRLSLAMRDAAEAEGTATFKEVREEDGVRVAVLEIELSATASASVEVEPPNEQLSAVAVGDSITRELTGVLLWDLEHGHIHSFQFDTETTRVRSTEMTIEAPDGSHERTQSEEFTGEGKYTYEVTRG